MTHLLPTLSFTMITGSVRTTLLLRASPHRSLGVVQARTINDIGPSSSQSDVPSPPMSYSSLRKGKQRATSDFDNASSLARRYRRTVSISRADHATTQIRRFHASRPRHALPLIPATAAILKVSGDHDRFDTADTLVYICSHRHNLRVTHSHLILPDRHLGCLEVQSRREMARRW